MEFSPPHRRHRQQPVREILPNTRSQPSIVSRLTLISFRLWSVSSDMYILSYFKKSAWIKQDCIVSSVRMTTWFLIEPLGCDDWRCHTRAFRVVQFHVDDVFLQLHYAPIVNSFSPSPWGLRVPSPGNEYSDDRNDVHLATVISNHCQQNIWIRAMMTTISDCVFHPQIINEFMHFALHHF